VLIFREKHFCCACAASRVSEFSVQNGFFFLLLCKIEMGKDEVRSSFCVDILQEFNLILYLNRFHVLFGNFIGNRIFSKYLRIFPRVGPLNGKNIAKLKSARAANA